MNKQLLLFVICYLIPFFLTISDHCLKGIALYATLFISDIGMLWMYALEIIAIKVEGRNKYLSSKWNSFD